ncbi:hypothetical protein HCMG_01380 [Helicobacter canadensis MIT 98-5491]|nr:hypothetical protein HCMG_01380 [Helicobacter canadensis MIT 98-5491]
MPKFIGKICTKGGFSNSTFSACNSDEFGVYFFVVSRRSSKFAA